MTVQNNLKSKLTIFLCWRKSNEVHNLGNAVHVDKLFSNLTYYLISISWQSVILEMRFRLPKFYSSDERTFKGQN